MLFYVLASGSAGNCCVIKSQEALLIIDCGMSWRYLKQRFEKYNIDYQKADGLLITHMHGDHVAQLTHFDNLPKYSCFALSNNKPIVFFQSLRIKDLEITPLPLSHDSEATTGFLIKDEKQSLVYITDTGYLSEKNLAYLTNADYYIMESNHDPTMLLNTARPTMLKHRILLDEGHLSNGDCAQYLSRLIGSKTKEIVLAHLSQEANDPVLAKKTLCEVLTENAVDYTNVKIKIAQQHHSCQGGCL